MNATYTVRLDLGRSEEGLKDKCRALYGKQLKYFKILKRSLDARKKSDIHYVYTIRCGDEEEKTVQSFEQVGKSPSVAVAGMGPAGLFCALRLLDHGIKPLLIERGKKVEEREKDIARFQREGVLDPSSNVQFGEGGAGTFSDGKLNTGTSSPYHREVIEKFIAFGAPEEIGYDFHPHIGSDNLKRIVARMREYLLKNGAQLCYETALTDVGIKDGRLVSVLLNGERKETDELVLAVGHSARDTFEMLLSRGFQMEQKEFAAGVRIEHVQADISRSQYGAFASLLPPADYKLVSHAGERAAFTFCMCPGGYVMTAASEQGGVVTNGMSNFLREGKNCNAALIAQVKKEDFPSRHPLAGVQYQREIEKKAYLAAGGGYRAPVQTVGDFLWRRESRSFDGVTPTYARGTSFAPLESYLPAAVTDALRAAIPDMDRRLRGFAFEGALLTGPETRTSSPVRIVRGEDLQAAGIRGVYPCGEGCGYAGGIMSAAADGVRVAEAIARKYL